MTSVTLSKIFNLSELQFSNLLSKQYIPVAEINKRTYVNHLVHHLLYSRWASLVAQMVKNPPAMWDTCVRYLGREKPLEKGGRSKGMGTEWDKEVVGKVDPQERVLCLARVFLRG